MLHVCFSPVIGLKKYEESGTFDGICYCLILIFFFHWNSIDKLNKCVQFSFYETPLRIHDCFLYILFLLGSD